MHTTLPDKSVIFTADDFGLADALNSAVVLSHRQGLRLLSLVVVAVPYAMWN